MGTVFLRRGSLWLNFYDAEGKRHQVKTGLLQGQEEQARALLKATEQRLAAPQKPAATTVAAYLEVWEDRRRREGLSMAKDDARDITNHCAELLTLPLAEVRPLHIRAVLSRLKSRMGPKREDLAPKTVRKVYGSLHTFFESAVAEELVPANPCNVPRGYLPKKLDKNPEWRAQAVFTREEARAIISEPLELFDRLTWAIVLFTGLRTGEISALRWRHIEFEVKPLGRMTVAFSWSRKAKREKPTKTGETRLAPIHPALAALLREWKLHGFFEHMGRHPNSDDLVLSNRDGSHINEEPRMDRLHRALGQLGLRTMAASERLRVHDLRRTFITLAQADGGLPASVRSITHTGKRDILDLYTSLPWEAKCAAVASLRLEPFPSSGAQVLQFAVGQSHSPVTGAVTDAPPATSHNAPTAEDLGGFNLSRVSGQGGTRTRTPFGTGF
ncbi:MAG: site-specific integrase [Archangium sp.]|nr:site-specific integrase [Archangium sp.]